MRSAGAEPSNKEALRGQGKFAISRLGSGRLHGAAGGHEATLGGSIAIDGL